MTEKIYIVQFDSNVEKQLDNLSNEIKKSIRKKIDLLKVNPKPINCKSLNGNLKGLFRIRNGDYRVVYSINNTKLIILIVKIAHRKSVYTND